MNISFEQKGCLVIFAKQPFFMKKLILTILLLNCAYLAFAQCVAEKLLDNELSRIKTFDSAIKTPSFRKLEKCNFTDSSKAKIYKQIAMSFFANEHDNAKAIEYIKKEIISWKKYRLKFNEKLADAYYNLGFFYNVSFQYDDAISNYEKVVSYTNDKPLKAICFKEIAELYIYLGDYKKAEINANKGVDELKNTALDDYTLATCYNALGISQEFQSNYQFAMSKYLLAKNLIKKDKVLDNEVYLLANVEYNIGKVYDLQNNKEQGLKQYVIASKLFSKTNELRMITLSNSAMSNSYDVNFKNPAKAALVLDESIQLLKKKYSDLKSPEICRLYSNASVVYLNNKEYSKADDAIKKAFETFPNVEDKTIEKLTKKDLLLIGDKWTFYDLLRSYSSWYLMKKYKITKDKKYLTKAKSVFEKADLLIDVMRSQHFGFENSSKFHWRERTHRLYESAIETCFLLKDYEKAFYFFEKSRSVLLNDKLNELGAKQKLSEGDLQQEKDFQKQISEVNASLEKTQNTKQKSDLNNQLIDLQEQQDRFVKTLETKNPAYFQIKYDTTTYRLKQIQDYLKTNNGSLVEYFVGDSATYAIVISSENVSLKKLNFNANNIQEFTNLCSQKIATKVELNDFLGLGSSIYKNLIMPLNIPKGHLIISQDGAFIPFEALSKSANKPDYLLHDFMISYTYSAQFLLRNNAKNYFLPNHKFIGIAPVNFTQKLNPLNGSAQSLEKIADNYFWSSKMIGRESSKKSFLTHAKSYQIVQIYTHAFADSNETEPRIYFADSTLKVSDLSIENRFNTNLLVLSACKTGVGKVAKGEGVLSLARGFSMAGIPSTITSLWSIEDRDTYILTELFYKYLNEGMPKDEALQKAKIEFIISTENAMPNAWAGMILIGDSLSLEKHNYLVFWILGGLLVGGISFWRFKRSKI
jgi:CHAT domain-containing protein